ncbi:hypothetical protein J4H92_14030 [Leucobacter weissii]|uniref:Uncharacterized protein n=1 Tax=Leucobacter weissii TaxID=1983706 RepID=A0A939MM37_9MICO|nr:hypothetical protein [Leucobacter weissii]MBO1903061.1 hypothetical protein [Leucobacter weissii]
MSVETVINLVAVVGSAVALYFLLRRPIDKLDAKLNGIDTKLDAKIDGVHHKLDAKIDSVHDNIDAKIDSVHDKIDAKIDSVHDKIDAKINGLARELSEFRIETKDEFGKIHLLLARHDERLSALERQQPRLLTNR